MCLSWSFSVGSPCESSAQLRLLETDSKTTSRANHAAKVDAVAIAMLCSHSEGCKLLQPFPGAHPDPRPATSPCRGYSRDWSTWSRIWPDSYAGEISLFLVLFPGGQTFMWWSVMLILLLSILACKTRGGNCLCLGAQCSLQKVGMEEVKLGALKEELWPKEQMPVHFSGFTLKALEERLTLHVVTG